MKELIIRHRQFIFYSVLPGLGMLQAYYTELMDDEAYYWLYSKFLGLGYFEHPPMIALLIKCGYLLFQNELGVRLLTVIISTGTIYIIQLLLTRKNDFLYYAIILSIAVTQLGSFIAVPDWPLLFFSSLFFYCYRRFLTNMGLRYILIMGVVCAGMLYSKYHGILVIFLVLLSNPSLFSKIQVWLAGLLTFLLFFPHIYWQWMHGFPTVYFQLAERHSGGLSFDDIVKYVSGQILLAGPVIGWLLLWCAFRKAAISKTERALKFTMTGIYAFFFAVSFMNKTEANWTVPALIGLIVLSHQYLTMQARVRKWVYIALPVSIVFVMCQRFFLMNDNPYTNGFTREEFHNNKNTAGVLKQKIGQNPLVVINSYQAASKYWFYGGHTSFSLNTTFHHRNSFNQWPVEDSLLGRTVFVAGHKDSTLSIPLQLEGFPETYGNFIQEYFSFSRIHFTDISNVSYSNGRLSFSCKINIPPHYLELFDKAPYDAAHIFIATYVHGSENIRYHSTNVSLKNICCPETEAIISCYVPLPQDSRRFSIAINTCLPGIYSVNSRRFGIRP